MESEATSSIPFGALIGLERASGADLSGVRVHTGPSAAAAADAEGARAFAKGDDITFNAGEYDPVGTEGRRLLAHEAAHVVQQRGGSPTVARKRFRDLNAPAGAESEADAFADAFVSGRPAAALTGVAAGIARKPKNQPDEGGAASEARKVQRRGGVHQLGEHKEWTMTEAEILTYELSPIGEVESEGKLTTKRTYRFLRAPGTHWETLIEVIVTGSAAYESNQIPRDLFEAAKSWPAIIAHQTATVRTVKGAGGLGNTMLLSDNGHAPGQTLAEIVSVNSLLAFERAPSERLRELYRHLRWLEDRSVDEVRLHRLRPKVNRALVELDEFMRLVEAQEERSVLSEPVPDAAVRNAEELLEELVLAESTMASRMEAQKAGELAARLRERIKHARWRHNPDRFFGQGVAEGFAETGRMAHDVGLKVADEIGEATGLYDIEWNAWSGIGQMREQGKGWEEITAAILVGLVDQIDHAITEASQGNFRPLAELGLELAVDALMPAGVVGGAAKAGAKGARAVGTGAKVAGKATMRGVRTAAVSASKRAKQVLDHLPTNAPQWVKDELAAISAGVKNAGKVFEVAADGPGVFDPMLAGKGLADSINSARLDITVGRAKESLEALGHAGLGDAAFDRLQKLAEGEGVSAPKLRQVIKRFSGQEGAGNIPALLASLEKTLGVAKRFEVSEFASLLAKATNAADPSEYLTAIRWLSRLDPEVRASLAGRIARHQSPDLIWLKGAGIELDELAMIARDLTTDWGLLQKRSALAENVPKDVRAAIGKKAEDLTAPPTDTEFWTPPSKQQKQLRWKANKRDDRPKLTVDSEGRIRVGPGDELSRALLGRGMRKTSGPRIPGHQDHHVIPIELARESELFRLARTKGKPPWNPNDPRNGIQLPETEAAQAVAPYSTVERRPLHSGNHPGYTRDIKQKAARALDKLKREHGSAEKIPGSQLSAVAAELQNQMAIALKMWPDLELN